jgi:hypothetical protein
VVWSLAFSSFAAAVELSVDSSVTQGVITTASGQQLAFYRQGATLSNGGDYLWWYGCSPTSAGMLLGYYDRNGYNGKDYSNLIQGGVATSYDSTLVRSAIASSRHISDFYGGGYGASGDDKSGSPTGSLNCLADYMRTSQDAYGNSNGATTFYYYPDGSRLYVCDIYNEGITNDGMYGIYDYITNYAGYDLGDASTCTALYIQLIAGYNGNTDGFTWEDYKAEIDAGRPVIIQVSGHTMLGYGYDDATDEILLHDTWSTGTHRMTWGGSYSGMAQWGVVCMTIPEPGTFVLLGMGMVGVVVVLWRRRR